LSGVLNLSQACAGHAGRGQVHLARQVGHVVVFLRDGGGAEGVGLDQVGPGGQVALVDVADHVGRVRLSSSLLPLTSLWKSLKRSPRYCAFAQLEALDHGAHGAVEDGDALLRMAGSAWARV
jgi:hypothetical protein